MAAPGMDAGLQLRSPVLVVLIQLSLLGEVRTTSSRPSVRHPWVRADVIGLTPTLNSTGHKNRRRVREAINDKSVIRSFAGL